VKQIPIFFFGIIREKIVSHDLHRRSYHHKKHRRKDYMVQGRANAKFKMMDLGSLQCYLGVNFTFVKEEVLKYHIVKICFKFLTW
jgi:hypothetical protein